jgi:hypothetical protein
MVWTAGWKSNMPVETRSERWENMNSKRADAITKPPRKCHAKEQKMETHTVYSHVGRRILIANLRWRLITMILYGVWLCGVHNVRVLPKTIQASNNETRERLQLEHEEMLMTSSESTRSVQPRSSDIEHRGTHVFKTKRSNDAGMRRMWSLLIADLCSTRVSVLPTRPSRLKF